MKKLASLLLALIVCAGILTSCSGNGSGQNTNSNGNATVSSGNTEDIPWNPDSLAAGTKNPNTGKYLNPFTGLFDLNESAYGKRPYAVMVSNIKEALPQWGIGEPDLCYEFLAEGGITRIVALFADGNDIPKIGPVRSARTYFIKTAMGYDAIYAHYGSSDTGSELIKSAGVTDLDGMTLGNSFFPRDAERRKERAIEHTAYTSGELLTKAVQKKKYRTDSKEQNYIAFTFNKEEDITKNGTCENAANISVNFSKYNLAEFAYKAEDKLYYKSEFGSAQIDATTKKQIAVRNVIAITDTHAFEENQICRVISQSSGTGYYFSDGKAIKITWSKGGNTNPYKFSLEDGNELKVNPGQTWVCVVPKDSSSRIKFS